MKYVSYDSSHNLGFPWSIVRNHNAEPSDRWLTSYDVHVNRYISQLHHAALTDSTDMRL